MKINNVVGFTGVNSVQNGAYGRNIAFGRKPEKFEEKEYTSALNRGFDYLGLYNRAFIIHGASFPADKKNAVDQHIGSPYGQKNFDKFVKLHGFNSYQLGPSGKLSMSDASPYTSSIFEKNPLLINLAELTKPKYASILSLEDLIELTDRVETTDKNYARVDYDKAKKISEEALIRAYDNFAQMLHNGDDKNADKLYNEFGKFKKQNPWLDKYAVANLFAKKNKDDYPPNWAERDRVFFEKLSEGDLKAQARFEEILSKREYEVDLYKFIQFLCDKQAKENNKNDITYIDDLLVGQSNLDILLNKNVFLDGYSIGASDGGPMNKPQLWGIPLVDPNKLFNKDGSLGESGLYLKEKLERSLKNSSNVRIDHVFGLVDPYVYKNDTVNYVYEKDANGREVSCPDTRHLVSSHLSQMEEADPEHNYYRILDEIVLPTMKENGVNPDEVVWENLGSASQKFWEIYHGLNLHGISPMQWVQGSQAERENWGILSCHDDMTTRQMAESADVRSRQAFDTGALAHYLLPGDNLKAEREALEHQIRTNPKVMTKAKLAELLRACDKAQISFMDMFGINKRYNTPGTTGPYNWTLRLNPDYEDTYYEALKNDDYAINMPEILKMAVRSKMEQDIIDGKNPEKTRREAEFIMKDLEHWENVLKS